MKKTLRGISLIEILVVVTVFSIIALIASRGVFVTLSGSRKSESTSKIRENLDYSFAVMERRLRNAESVSCSSSTQVDYLDKNSVSSYFSCEDVSGSGYISSASARLTTDEIKVTSCSFTCDSGGSGVLPSVSISATGESVGTTGVEGSQVTVSTKIFLRTY